MIIISGFTILSSLRHIYYVFILYTFSAHCKLNGFFNAISSIWLESNSLQSKKTSKYNWESFKN